jgi:hypothetical protein
MYARQIGRNALPTREDVPGGKASETESQQLDLCDIGHRRRKKDAMTKSRGRAIDNPEPTVWYVVRMIHYSIITNDLLYYHSTLWTILENGTVLDDVTAIYHTLRAIRKL